ncbi:MAG TPA: acyl-CoA synthetase [Acidimicrobiales bacterium]|nr:acyl-CoA synthetase [Acidimicrobiales bacterium]
MHPGIHAQRTPDKPAVIMASGATVTYAELDRRANRAAHLLHSLGLRPGDHVAWQVGNQPEFFDLVWAAHRSGLWYTTISTRLGPEETAYIVDDCAARVFVAGADMTTTLGGLGDVSAARFVLGGQAPGWESWDRAVAAQPDTPLAEMVGGDDLLYSSGTTGRPKGVERASGDTDLDQPDGVTALAQLMFGFDSDTVYLSPAPLYHAAPLRFTRAVHRLGGTVVQMERFDPVEYLRLIEKYSVTATQLVPTMFVRMLKLDPGERARFDVSSLRAAIHAAAPCPVPIKQQMIEWWGPVIWEYYAGTEGNGMVLCNSEQWLTHPGTVGQSINARVHILDADGNEVPPGAPGAIYFESAADFRYRNDPDKTASAHTAQGWSTLGDIGYVDEEGWLFLTDRKANMIISGGVNIYPQEAENLLTLHPKVADVAVFGVPNEEMGEEVKAVVEPAAGVTAGPDLEDELIAYCRQHLAGYKCPRSIDFQAQLPREANGKLYKRLLKDRYWEGHASRIV